MYLLNKTLLQVLQERKSWERLWGSIHPDRFDKEVRVVLNSINKYWKRHDGTVLDPEVFSGKFFLDIPMDDTERAVYHKVFDVMQMKPDPVIAKEIIRDLRLMEFNKEVEDAQNKYVLGEDIDLYETVRSLSNEFAKDVRLDADTGYCNASIEDVINDEQHGSRLQWGLRCLNGAMPGVRTGMQILIGARPGVGKTSFLADSCIHFLKSAYPRESKRPIVWLNNEGKKIRVKGNCIRAALGRTFEEIQRLGWDKSEDLYHEAIGSKDMLRIYDIHGRNCAYIERIIEHDNPCVVVWDMLDNVRGNQGSNKNERDDERLESLYKWARECAVNYDFLSLPTSQVSVEGDGLQWVPASALKGSKTGKQGACDAIITIGFDQSPKYADSRFIYVPKTKFLAAKGFLGACQTEVFFDAGTSRYLNPKLK